ncbi:hypothetical protein NDU88_005458 [Pleurodeles waltl]|uniref:Uncharacterized protein n=1 Tax=Pleurodeles waltl TaxID=8319 RepID=A0AAV7MA20_PLEWA|nr:hypothetical protein NDU88_005458 [Pleurodeles waltl]
MAGTGRLRSGTDTVKSQDSIIQDSQKLDAVLAAVERIGNSLERACRSLEAKIDKVASDLVLLHADHRKLADKTSEVEAKVNELTPATTQLCAPDLEQLIQERREAIHTAPAINASPLASGSDTELSQPASDHPLKLDRLSESGLTVGPPVAPATADELF